MRKYILKCSIPQLKIYVKKYFRICLKKSCKTYLNYGIEIICWRYFSILLTRVFGEKTISVREICFIQTK